MKSDDHRLERPSILLLLLEVRALAELMAGLLTATIVRRSARGDGHPVLVLPGFLSSDFSTRLLRRFLRHSGYDARPWRLGRNYGLRGGLEERLIGRLRDVRQSTGRRVSVLGWSLGGVYARLLGHRARDDVRSVLTLGAPYNCDPHANHGWRVYEWTTGQSIDRLDPELVALMRTPPPVPTTSFYTRTDGIVAWRCCVEPEGPLAENVGIYGSHAGMGYNPLVLYALLDRLAEREGEWRRFRRDGLRKLFYRPPLDGRQLDGELGGAALSGGR